MTTNRTKSPKAAGKTAAQPSTALDRRLANLETKLDRIAHQLDELGGFVMDLAWARDDVLKEKRGLLRRLTRSRSQRQRKPRAPKAP